MTLLEHKRLYRDMAFIRRFEARCAELYAAGKIRGFLHLYDGEEAVAVGVSRALDDDDRVVATYREHGQALARGLSAERVMAELFGKREGSSGGRGGSMHIFDVEKRFYGGNAIVAAGLPVAVGLALGDKLQGRSHVTACFFGDGAVAEGEFHESLNLASLWHLPVLFVCENNLYAMGSALRTDEAQMDLASKARSYGMRGESVDGMDVLAVMEAARAAVDEVRRGSRVLLELKTYRFRAHSMFDAQLYRDKAEIERWKERDPLVLLRKNASATLTDDVVRAIENGVEREIDAAVAFAERGTLEPAAELLRDVVAPRSAPSTRGAVAGAVSAGPVGVVTYRECCKQAIRECLVEEPKAFLMGEDVGSYGGCYAVTKGLLAELGPEKVRDTPMSESVIVGAGIGAATVGMHPIVEVMTCNFALLALDQIINNAATLRHMSGGQVRCPLVIRMATGAGRQLAAQHSHSFEGWLAHVPGLKVLVPATLDDARGMLPLALREPDPVLLFEHVGLYNMEGELAGEPVDVERARLRRLGGDVSLITSGASLYKCMAAAEELSARGIEADVLDLRVLRPLDDNAIAATVRRTHRPIVVDEGWRSVGLAGEIIARICELCFDELDAPPKRICTADVPIPYAQHLEQAALPQVADIVSAAVEVCGG